MEKINLSKIRRCDQYWEDMPETDQGRLCQKCNRCMTDFRQMTYLEIAIAHANSADKVCGIYREDQLQFPSTKVVAASGLGTSIKQFFATTLPFLAILNTTEAQPTTTPKEKVVIVDRVPDESVVRSSPVVDTQHLCTIQGRVVDESGSALIGASVLIKNTTTGIATDIDGNFELLLNNDTLCNKDSITLQFSYIGYATLERVIGMNVLQEEQGVTLAEAVMVESSHIISFGISSKELKRQKRRSWMPWRKEFWRRFKR